MADNLTLAGLSVLDLGNRASTAWCSRLLADYGAEVIGIEPEKGHPVRQHGPFDLQGKSIPAQYLLINKSRGAIEQVPTLVGNADIILTSSIEGDWGAQKLAIQNGQALVCAITPYGLDGALCGYTRNTTSDAPPDHGRRRISCPKRYNSHCPSALAIPPV